MPKKILLADDSITIQKVVELTFSDGDYEVIAVNNGAKAVQKLSEIRPDIILSDIIMPEKNGYEVCEFVKSHPEYRNIPVILLTGTFEPFDPDRADKAGCDAVVTKPFESQSLIHKVEELIEQARSAAPAVPSAAMSEAPPAQTAKPSPWMGEPVAPSSPSAAESTKQLPSVPDKPAASPWDEQPPPPSGETRAFPRMNFEEMQRPSQPAAASASMVDADSPFGASPSVESFSGETRAFPKMNFDDLQPPPMPPATKPPAQESAPSPWDDQSSYSGETRGFPKMSFDELPAAKPASPPAPSPWDETPAPSTKPEPSMPAEEPAWAPASATSSASAAPEPVSHAADGNGGAELTDKQVDRIARRVVQMMSDQVVRNIAWEVIPDLAEMVVKERIRQLESE